MPFALPPAETRLPLTALVRGLLPLKTHFSEQFVTYLGVDADSCVLAGSARSLLYLLLRTLRSQACSGSATEVLIPGYTCYSVAAAVVKAGLKVQLYDLDPNTLQPDFDDLSRKISGGTLAVIGQHLLGVRTEMRKLARIAKQQGVCCIEDSAQYLNVGQVGMAEERAADYTLFSFGRGKPMPLGGGGALIGKETGMLSRVAEYLQSITPRPANPLLPFAIRLFSWPKLYWMLERLPLGLGRTVYDPEFTVASMPTLYQRIGTRALAGLAQLNRHRVEISRTYRTCLGGSPQQDSAHVRFPVLVREQDEVTGMARFGVRRLYPLALCDLPPLGKHLVQLGLALPGAREIAERLVTLPTHRTVDSQCAQAICYHLRTRFGDLQLIKQESTGLSATPAVKMETVNAV